MFDKKKSFSKLLLNSETSDYIRGMIGTLKSFDHVRTKNIKSAVLDNQFSFKNTKMSEFRLNLKNNKLLNHNEVDIREEIKEIASGYPKFIDASINPPDLEIKRESLLFKLFQMKGIKV